MHTRKRPRLNITIDPESRERLERLADRRGQSLSRVLDDLIDEAWNTEDHYMIKQAALHSFVSMALAIATARKTLGYEGADAVRKEAARVATTLFGKPPRKRFDYREETDSDPRIEAVFEAFENCWP